MGPHGLFGPIKKPPVNLLRVGYNNNTFQNFNMVAGYPNMPITKEAFDDCLCWRPNATPFIPFTIDWGRALKRRRKLIGKGRQDVVIIAVWSKGLHNVYDAYEAAKTLRYRDGNVFDGHPQNQGIAADEYRVLAIFDGQNELEGVPLSVPGLIGPVTVPSFIPHTPRGTMKEMLEEQLQECLRIQIYSRTGIRGDSEQLLHLKRYMMGTFAPLSHHSLSSVMTFRV
ncbi:conserved hypothetical protein [Talaromyces stipitatus ATCC 10500]|uniref:Uncharacterized protein n=1 Tax=Talaromyces stipitatus (strain ATCC 10500 / CBS 375.48 / QM 6759 / NRRL 1006) TaxID=441959 RepID=B8M9M9_TALSN|nr:uncharacterized protein TSTA_118030 [Talaromyces stipitatus ATCC 10500]EED18031.1 conserved hypothetical protein [Talaromyces stipitatus ATCC 10500]